MIRWAGFLGCAALAWLALAAGASAADVTLRFGTINQAGTAAFDQVLVPFVRAVEAKSDGKLAIDLKPLGGYGKPIELLGMVESGQIDIASTVQGYHPGRFPRSSVMELPLIYDAAETGTAAFWRLYEEGLLGPEYDAFKVLALYVVPPYGIFLTPEYKVTSLRDLRGLRVRVASVTAGLAMSRLGMIPIGMPLNLIGTMLNDKLIDGVSYGWDTSISTVLFEKKALIEQLGTMVDANLSAPALCVLMNRKVYDGLAPELRAAIDSQSGLEFALASARLRDQLEARAKDTVARSADHEVVKLTDADRKEIEHRIAPAFDDWIADMQRQGIDAAALLARARALGAHS